MDFLEQPQKIILSALNYRPDMTLKDCQEVLNKHNLFLKRDQLFLLLDKLVKDQVIERRAGFNNLKTYRLKG